MLMLSMPRQKELSEDLWSWIVNLHKSRKSYKVISKTLKFTSLKLRQQSINKWRNFGYSTKNWAPRQNYPSRTTMSLQYVKYRTSQVSVAEHHQGNHCILQRTMLHTWSLRKKCTLTLHNGFSKMVWDLMKPRLNYWLKNMEHYKHDKRRALHIIMKISS